VRRKTVLHFRLAAAGRVVFTVTQVSPACTRLGSFAVAGRAGMNKISFGGRLHGKPLAPGTYKIAAHVAGHRTVLRVTVVVVDVPPTPSALAAARSSDVCRSLRSLAPSTASSSAGFTGALVSDHNGGPSGGAMSGVKGTATEVAPAPHTPATPSAGTVHASAFSPARVSANASNPLVVFALAMAVMLLGLAALPKNAVPDPRLTDLLARHRVEVALAGAAALATGLLALALV
jgi:hypothetical protein